MNLTMRKKEGERPVQVVDHAIVQFQKRRPGDERANSEIRKWIEKEVAEAISGGRMSDRKPKEFRLYRERNKGKLFHALDRCVWTESKEYAWVVRRLDGIDLVMTTLTPSEARKER